MKSKRLFQIFVLLVVLLSPIGSASASTGPAPRPDAVVFDRNLSYWDANYLGFVSSSIYENWRFEFTASHNFVVTVTKVTGDVVPRVLLLDANGNELGRGTGSLTSTQPAGSYSFQIQPESGMGVYMLTLREVAPPTQPFVSTTIIPTSINMGEMATVTVGLGDIPTDGYASAEFTCSYNASLLQVGNITLTDLFGMDPVMAATTPQNGSFILAIAGSNGKKATASGAAFNFSVIGLQAGQSSIECQARVSKGDGVLITLPSTPASLTVIAVSTPTPTFTLTPEVSPTPTMTSTPEVSPTPTFTSTPEESPTPTLTPEESPTPTSTPEESPTPTATFTSTPEESPTPTATFTSTPEVSPTPTSTSVPTTGTLTGEVHAGKPITVSLYDASNTLITSVVANTDGTFSLTAPAGSYTAVATAEGFLKAAGSVTLTAGNTSTKPAITLLAGDIDNNDVIDQFDAMTIGMSYNTAIPAAADLNNDGVINVLDLELLARNYRATGPTEW